MICLRRLPGAAPRAFPSRRRCFVAKKLLETLRLNNTGIDPTKERLYRLAALLHDVGHYPFSHATERAIKARSRPKNVRFYDHEDVRDAILEHDTQLHEALDDAGLALKGLQRTYSGEDVFRLEALISSDIDADRVDFLRRTAIDTGLPYGLIDVQYLTSELRLDRDGRVCWQERALAATDQLLLARYFDYQQVAHNKTVVGFEEILQILVRELLERGDLKLSADDIDEMIKNGDWFSFDDHSLFERIKSFSKRCEESGDERCRDALKPLCDALLKRYPPKQVFPTSDLLAPA